VNAARNHRVYIKSVDVSILRRSECPRKSSRSEIMKSAYVYKMAGVTAGSWAINMSVTRIKRF
jgi:hypothetical protein